MSFLLDPPLLVATGATIERKVADERTRKMLDRLVLGTFIGVSSALYLDLPGLGFIWRPLRARSGRDWMLNSGVFRFEYRDPPPTTHLVAAAIFATYPLWLALGHRLGRRLGR
ncbi:MAG: hypothetical protein KatS3mg008_1746 [Acidimicrobiales bacterium]|nr:MAG: hypothetical protein KatS3mg008_1746 [Acidimicrobiales bacterium]